MRTARIQDGEKAKVLILLVLSSSLSFAQPTRTEKALWIGGASIAFASIDYIGYNATKDANGIAPVGYRVFQFATQAAITWFLYENLGLSSTIAFNVIWWTFTDDLLYYGIAETNILKFGDNWEGRGTFDRATNGGLKHAYWTPLGMVNGRLRQHELFQQSFVGISISLAIL